jgi:subtilisin family serine protease
MKKDSKIDPRLQEELGIDAPDDIFRVIVEFHNVAAIDVSSLQSTGASIVNVSRSLPYVTVEATKEQILRIEQIASVKKIWYNAPVGVLDEISLPYDASEAGPYDIQVTLGDTTKHINADKVWEKGFTGNGVKVAVLDTGVNSSHPMLQGKVIAKFQTIDGNIEDGHGHGTWCASCVAGNKVSTDYGELVGMAPNARIINGKVLSDDGVGYFDGIILGMEKAVIDYHADIISMSLGRTWDCDSPLWQAVDSLINQYGVIFCIAAGNAGPVNAPSDPGIAFKCITVGASSIKVGGGDKIANFSSRGPSVHKGIYPDVVAPGGAGGGDQEGERIVGAWGSSYLAVRGTSMATPHVAGMVALLQEALGRRFTEPEIKSLLSKSCVEIPPEGKDNDTGWGRIDCLKALNNLPTPPPPVRSSLGLLIPLMVGGFILPQSE